MMHACMHTCMHDSEIDLLCQQGEYSILIAGYIIIVLYNFESKIRIFPSFIV
jgi:hypothetical protein